jgi:hypothetical protein
MKEGLDTAQHKGPFSSLVNGVIATARFVLDPEFRAERKLTPAEKEAWDGIKDISIAYYHQHYSDLSTASLMAGVVERVDCKTRSGRSFSLTRSFHTLPTGTIMEAIMPSGRDSNQLHFLTPPLLSSLFETARFHARGGAETSEAS